METNKSQDQNFKGYNEDQMKETAYLTDEQVQQINSNLELQYEDYEEFCEAMENQKKFNL